MFTRKPTDLARRTISTVAARMAPQGGYLVNETNTTESSRGNVLVLTTGTNSLTTKSITDILKTGYNVNIFNINAIESATETVRKAILARRDGEKFDILITCGKSANMRSSLSTVRDSLDKDALVILVNSNTSLQDASETLRLPINGTNKVGLCSAYMQAPEGLAAIVTTEETSASQSALARAIIGNQRTCLPTLTSEDDLRALSAGSAISSRYLTWTLNELNKVADSREIMMQAAEIISGDKRSLRELWNEASSFYVGRMVDARGDFDPSIIRTHAKLLQCELRKKASRIPTLELTGTYSRSEESLEDKKLQQFIMNHGDKALPILKLAVDIVEGLKAAGYSEKLAETITLKSMASIVKASTNDRDFQYLWQELSMDTAIYGADTKKLAPGFESFLTQLPNAVKRISNTSASLQVTKQPASSISPTTGEPAKSSSIIITPIGC